MMAKITGIVLTYDNGEAKSIARKDTKWLFIALSEDGWKQLSLSGNAPDDAFLLRILENAVVHTMNQTNVYNDKGGT